jgi:hypothetical protein
MDGIYTIKHIEGFTLYTISVGLFWKICTGFIQCVYAGYIEERTQKKAQK